MKEKEPILAWHFLSADGQTTFPPRVKVEVGQTLTCEGRLKLCKNGLHASVRALDALTYALGPIVCRVRLEGEREVGEDKLCARKRTCLAMADATAVLHEFACRCAERALEGERTAGREPDPRAWAAVETKRRWLKGEATDAGLAAASAAAWEAAWEGASAAAWGAARAAARGAAWNAAWNAAREAVWNAASQAASQAAREAAWEAAKSAAGNAAREAEIEWQRAELEAMLVEVAEETQ